MPNDTKRQDAVILVIDSDPLILTGTAAVLNAQGYECHMARDGESALRVVRGRPLDLIISDVNLDGESGLDLVGELRREPGAEDVPIMFVSAVQMPDIVRRAHEAGGAYYLRKPFDPDVLVDLVEKALWLPHLVNTRIEASQQSRPRPSGLGRQSTRSRDTV